MINRRNVLRGVGGLAMVPMFMHSVAAREATSSNTIVVAILLAGGNDGLNTVVPLKHYGDYYTLRTPANPPQGWRWLTRRTTWHRTRSTRTPPFRRRRQRNSRSHRR